MAAETDKPETTPTPDPSAEAKAGSETRGEASETAASSQPEAVAKSEAQMDSTSPATDGEARIAAGDAQTDTPAKSGSQPADQAKADTKPTSEPEAPTSGQAPAANEAEPASEPASVSDLADLGALAGDTPDAGEREVRTPSAPLREQQLDASGRAYATGRRKDAVARVWLKPGKGKVVVNGRDQEVYFARPTLRLVINQPFAITEREGQYDIVATVSGGGLSGQAGAVKHGISQALTKYEPTLRSLVKAAGFLTRDSRTVERKKYGRAKARRSFQFSKR